MDLYDMEHRQIKPKDRRCNQDIMNEYLNPEEVFNKFIANIKPIPYCYDVEHKQERDKALVAALYASGLRISELLSVTRDRIAIEPDAFLIFRAVKIQKQLPSKYLDKALPLKGRLAPFTNIVWEYVKPKRGKVKLFDIDRTLGHRIVRATTGKWPHYFRAQHISYLVNDLNMNENSAAKLTGHKNPGVISIYHQATYNEFREELLK